MSTLTVTHLLLIGTALVLAWDIWLYHDDVERNSITQVLIDRAKTTPFIPFMLGFLMGHLFG